MKTVISITTENDVPLNFSNDFCDLYPCGNTFVLVDYTLVEVTLKSEMSKDYESATKIATDILQSYGCKVLDTRVETYRD